MRSEGPKHGGPGTAPWGYGDGGYGGDPYDEGGSTSPGPAGPKGPPSGSPAGGGGGQASHDYQAPTAPGPHHFYFNGFVPWANVLYANQSKLGTERAQGGQLDPNRDSGSARDYGQFDPQTPWASVADGPGTFLGGQMAGGGYTPGMANYDAWLGWGLGQKAPTTWSGAPVPIAAVGANQPAPTNQDGSAATPTPEQKAQQDWAKSLYGR